MFRRRRPEPGEPTYQEQVLDAIAANTTFGGDATAFVGHEALHTGIGMSHEDSKRYADVTRIAVREVLSRYSKTPDQDSDLQ